MKKSAIAFFCTLVLGIFASSSNAAEFSYRIEVCSLPLVDIIVDVHPLVKSIIASQKLQHMFIRGIEGDQITGLNFEPENGKDFLGGKARIGSQNYPQATSAVLFSTNNKDEYDLEWARFLVEYNEALQHQYSVTAKNCQVITQEVINKLDYKMPQVIQAIFDQQGIKVQDNQVNCAQQ